MSAKPLIGFIPQEYEGELLCCRQRWSGLHFQWAGGLNRPPFWGAVRTGRTVDMERAFRTILNALRPATPLPRSPGGLRLSAALLLSLAVAACASAPAADPGTVAAPATTGASVPAPIPPPPGLNIAATPGRPAVYLVDPDEPATETSQTSPDNVGERSAATHTLAPKPIAPPVATTDAQGVVHLNPAQAEQAADRRHPFRTEQVLAVAQVELEDGVGPGQAGHAGDLLIDR